MRAHVKAAAAIVIVSLVIGMAGSPAVSAAATRNRGYWIAGQNSQVFAFGDAQLYAQGDGRALRGQIVDMAAHPGGRGYWLLGQDGGVYPYGAARDLGQGALREQNAAAIGATPSGDGYFIASELGEVRPFGDAVSRGSLDKKDLKRRVVDMAVTPSGAGYWLVDVTGQVYVFGDAASFGSASRSDVVAIAPTPRGDGYWLACANGDVLAFGNATARGSLADRTNQIVDMTPTYSGGGYWLVDRDGLVFAFGDATLYGQLARGDLRSGQIVAIVSTPFVNHDPVANLDVVTLDEDTTIDIDVLANDTDEDGDPLHATGLTQPSHGTASLNADGTIHYVPARDYNGEDAFTYALSDGVGGSATGQVRLVIRPVNDAPVAVDDAFTTDEDTPYTGSIVGNDTDVDGDALVVQLVIRPAHGTLDVNADGTVTYTPVLNFNGDDAFTYRAFDGALTSNVATVRIHVNAVNDAPVATPDSATLDEDTSVTMAPPGVLANDTDLDGDALSASLATGPAHGTVVLTSGGGYTYTPAPNYNGTDGFTYRASDGALDSGDVTVAITVNPVNDVPTGSADTYSGTEDTALVVGAPGLLANDTDVDGDPLTASLVQGPAHGTLTLLPDGSFSYVPSADFNGDDVFTYAARDAVSASAPIVVTIHLAAVNDPPYTTDDTFGVLEDRILTVAAPGVLGNDRDVDSATFTATLVTGPAHGTLVFASDGSFVYTPAPNYFGPDSFTYTASDGSAVSPPTTVVVFVEGTNDAPIAVPDLYTTDEDTPLIIGAPGVMANDSDVDGDVLFVRLGERPLHGDVTLLPDGSFAYIPDANFNGTDGFQYDLSDGSETVFAVIVTIVVNAVADPPDAVNDGYSAQTGTTLNVAAPGVLANDFSDSGTMTAVLVTNVAHGSLTLNANGSFSYTTNLTTSGTDSFTYKVNDGAVDSDPATVTITVTASSGGGGTGGTFGGFTGSTLTVWDFDSLKISGSTTGGSLKTKLGRIVIRSDGTYYQPDRGARGRDSFTYGSRHYEIDVISDIWGD